MWGVGSPLWTLRRTPKTCFWGQGTYSLCTLPAQKKEVSGICLAGRKTPSISRGPKAALPRGRAAVWVRGPGAGSRLSSALPRGWAQPVSGTDPSWPSCALSGPPLRVCGPLGTMGSRARGAPGPLSVPRTTPSSLASCPALYSYPSDALVSLFLSIGHHSPLYGQPLSSRANHRNPQKTSVPELKLGFIPSRSHRPSVGGRPGALRGKMGAIWGRVQAKSLSPPNRSFPQKLKARRMVPGVECGLENQRSGCQNLVI